MILWSLSVPYLFILKSKVLNYEWPFDQIKTIACGVLGVLLSCFFSHQLTKKKSIFCTNLHCHIPVKHTLCHCVSFLCVNGRMCSKMWNLSIFIITLSTCLVSFSIKWWKSAYRYLNLLRTHAQYGFFSFLFKVKNVCHYLGYWSVTCSTSKGEFWVWLALK